MDAQGTKKVPVFFNMLSADDRAAYEQLRHTLTSPGHRYNRNRRLATLRASLDTVYSFCVRGDPDDCLRCLVCGIYWFPVGELAINTRQLRILLAKSKSTINGALAKMDYVTLPTKDEERDKLIEALPHLRADWLEVRQWTIRRLGSKTEESSDVEAKVETEPPQPFEPFPALDMNLEWIDEPILHGLDTALRPGDCFNMFEIVDDFSQIPAPGWLESWDLT
jgi:hypothetical protein